jgi:hypothetical protein
LRYASSAAGKVLRPVRGRSGQGVNGGVKGDLTLGSAQPRETEAEAAFTVTGSLALPQ